MKIIENKNGGFIGILMILITVTVIIFIMLRTDMFTGKKGSKSILEQDLNAVEQAKDVKALLEKNSAQTIDIN